MSRHVTRQGPRHVRRLLGAAASALALLVLGAPAAIAAPGGPQLTVSAATPDSVTLTATGFALQSTVEFTVSVGTCAGRSSVLATTDTLVARFVTTPACTGPANATATAGTQAAGVAFAFDTPVGGASPAGAASAGAAPGGAAPSGAAPGGAASTGAAPGGAPADATAQTPGRRPVASPCTVRASGDSVPAVKPGDTVCFTGALPKRLEIRGGGSDTAPVTYSGMGSATVPGVTARGSNIVLEGFVSKGANDNGFYVSGKNITIRDNDISQVSITTDDVDAIRFFGDGITIAHNDAHDIWANPGAGGAPHTDCIQTYAHSEPASSNVRIEGNKCASPQFHQCLMAEGPNDFEDGSSGIGRSANWMIANNYFDCHAEAQTIALQDVHDVTFSKNDFAGTGAKAIALQKDATGATVEPDNTKGPGYRELVGIDDASARQGYRGPDAGSDNSGSGGGGSDNSGSGSGTSDNGGSDSSDNGGGSDHGSDGGGSGHGSDGGDSDHGDSDHGSSDDDGGSDN